MCLVGAALLLLDFETRKHLWFAQYLALFLGLTAYIAVLGYVYGAEALYRVPGFTSMALHTAILFVLLSIGLLCSRPERGLIGLALAKDAGGLMLRRLLPAAVVLPPLVGWFRLIGQRQGLYTFEFGLALFAVCNVLIFVGISWWAAKGAQTIDVKLHQAQELVSLRNELKAAQDRLQLAFEGGQIATWDTDLVTGEVHLSKEWSAILGGPQRETQQSLQALMQRVHPEDFDHALRMSVETMKGTRQEYIEEHRVRTDAGDWRWIQSRGRVTVRNAEGRALRMTGTNVDITDRKRSELALRESEERFRSLTQLSSDWYWEQDEQFRFIAVSADVEAKAGSSAAWRLGKTRWELPAIGVTEDEWDRHRAILEAHEPFFDFELRRVNDRGETIWITASGVPTFDERGRFKGYRGVSRNVTERKNAALRTEFLAEHDGLTGLPNRSLLADRAGQAIIAATREGKCLALLFLDLDRFKQVNDSFGHDVGDLMLKAVVGRITNAVRKSDTVARVGGDEFVVLVSGVKTQQDVATVATKILTALSEPLRIAGLELTTGSSIGISLFPRDGGTFDALVKTADAAMYRAKHHGRGTFEFFSGTGARA
jgi:diguanylate cyclase (GGDEF)-like protein/PAS domain S-box-containing protein